MRLHWTDLGLHEASRVISEAVDEGKRQERKWGVQTHSPAQWFLILGEEFGELGQAMCAAEFDGKVTSAIHDEAIQVATLALKIADMARQAEKKP